MRVEGRLGVDPDRAVDLDGAAADGLRAAAFLLLGGSTNFVLLRPSITSRAALMFCFDALNDTRQ